MQRAIRTSNTSKLILTLIACVPIQGFRIWLGAWACKAISPKSKVQSPKSVRESKVQSPRSKVIKQDPKADFGLWTFDFGPSLHPGFHQPVSSQAQWITQV